MMVAAVCFWRNSLVGAVGVQVYVLEMVCRTPSKVYSFAHWDSCTWDKETEMGF